MRNPGRFSECRDCLFHNRNRENPLCRDCTAGEFFEERVRIRDVDEDMISTFARMTHDQ